MDMENSLRTDSYDVIIMGSGIGGSMLGSILARQNLNVLIIDNGTHPRFAIGEATTPDTSFRLKLIAAKYDVPEIANLSTFHKLRDKVGASHGVKRAFSFLYHNEGEYLNPRETNQLPTLAAPLGPDCHFFRQDTDSYLLSIAAKYGAKVKQATGVTDIQFKDDAVHLTTNRNEKFQAKFLIDGTGYKSPLAEMFDMRNTPDALETNSRSIFTHMVDVEFYDSFSNSKKDHNLTYPMSQTTLHHVVDGAWMWVIPFNNHAQSTNPLCSVGIMFDRSKYPETGMDAEEEFFEFIAKFPDIERQFKDAKAIRPWVSTGRIQYSSKSSYGDRFFMLPHASGFIDPLFSSGLNITTGLNDILARKIIDAVKNNDFSQSNFDSANEFIASNIALYDKVVANSFFSFHNYQLWDAWFRVWSICIIIGTSINANQYLRYIDSKDKSLLENSENIPFNGLLGSKLPYCKSLLDRACEEIDNVKNDRKSPEEAARNIRALFKNATFFPDYWNWEKKNVRTSPAFTATQLVKMHFWYRKNSPPEVIRDMYSWKLSTGLKYFLASILADWKSNFRRGNAFIRDVFWGWNNEWRVKKNSKKLSRET